jgi:hypothetical protein
MRGAHAIQPEACLPTMAPKPPPMRTPASHGHLASHFRLSGFAPEAWAVRNRRGPGGSSPQWKFIPVRRPP